MWSGHGHRGLHHSGGGSRSFPSRKSRRASTRQPMGTMRRSRMDWLGAPRASPERAAGAARAKGSAAAGYWCGGGCNMPPWHASRLPPGEPSLPEGGSRFPRRHTDTRQVPSADVVRVLVPCRADVVPTGVETRRRRRSLSSPCRGGDNPSNRRRPGCRTC